MSELENLIASQFKKLTGVSADNNHVLNLSVFPKKREPLKQLLRSVLPDLRIRNLDGVVTVSDFANYIENAESKKKAFFNQGLQIVREITKNESLSLDDDLYAELRPTNETGNAHLSAQCRYFFKASSVYTALSVGLKGKHQPYYPPTSQLERCGSLKELINLYYRRGKF